jgi:hypothetical protein
MEEIAMVLRSQVRLDAVAKAKEDALAFSQQTLEEDAKKFEDYLQERISKASNATMLGGTSCKFGSNIWFPKSGLSGNHSKCCTHSSSSDAQSFPKERLREAR